MEQILSGTEYEFSCQIRGSEALRGSFNRLATQIFHLDFEPWYRSGYWGDGYTPYTLSHGGEVVANVSVSPMRFRRGGREESYIQLGTVMTAPAYRGRGLSRWLISRVLDEWLSRCDGAFLFANDRVREFYPRFGFAQANQRQWSRAMSPGGAAGEKPRRLDMAAQADRQLLLGHYRLSNPFSAFSMEQNPGLLMFYCLQFLRDAVYYMPQFDTVAVAEADGRELICYDAFGPAGPGLASLLSALPFPQAETVRLGFTPKDPRGFTPAGFAEPDTTLFLRTNGENPFAGGELMFPLLSHT